MSDDTESKRKLAFYEPTPGEPVRIRLLPPLEIPGLDLGHAQGGLRHGELSISFPWRPRSFGDDLLAMQRAGRMPRTGKSMMWPTLELDYAKVERRVLANMQRLPRWWTIVDEIALQPEPKPLAFRVSAALVAMISPPPLERAPILTFDSCSPGHAR